MGKERKMTKEQRVARAGEMYETYRLGSYEDGAGARAMQAFYKHDTAARGRPGAAAKGTAYAKESWLGKNPVMDRWHELFHAMLSGARQVSVDELKSMLDDNVVFHPPPYWQPKTGGLLVAHILRNVGEIFGPSFRYHRQFQDEAGLNFVLEFSTMIEEVPCLGVDIIQLDGNHAGAKIVDFKVMVRPAEAALRLRMLMTRRIATIQKQIMQDMKRRRGKL